MTHFLCLPHISFTPTPGLFLDMEEEEEMIFFADLTRFITDPDFCYQEFARREDDHFQVFRVQVRTRPLCVFYLTGGAVSTMLCLRVCFSERKYLFLIRQP